MIQSIERAADILDLFLEHKTLKALEIAHQLNLHINTTRHILYTLESKRLLSRVTGGAYTLGYKCHLLGLRCSIWGELRSIALPIIRQLADRLGNAIFLGGERDAQLFSIAAYSDRGSTLVIEEQHWLGQLHSSACGKIMLAYGRKELWDILKCKGELLKFTDSTITDFSVLKKECEEVKSRGWAICKNESVNKVSSLAVGIFDGNRKILAAMSEHFPSYYLENGDIDAKSDVAELKKSARLIAAQYNLLPAPN